MFLLLLLGIVGLVVGIVLSVVRSRQQAPIPGSRPTLATIICLWEFLSGAGNFVSQAFTIYYRTRPLPYGIVINQRAYIVASALVMVECVLGIMAGVALWRMMRLAVPIFALKYVLSFCSMIVFYMRLRDLASHHNVGFVVGLTQFIFLGLSVAILIYVERITRNRPYSVDRQ